MLEKRVSKTKSRLPLIVQGDAGHMAALVLATGLNVLPPTVRAQVLQRLSQIIGTIWYKTNRRTVQRVRHHLQVLFRPDTDTKLEHWVKDHLMLTCFNAFIINLLPSLHDSHWSDLIHIQGLSHLDELRKQNQKILLLGTHYGAYGYAIAAALSAQGYPTWLVGYGSSYAPPPHTSYLYNTLYWPRIQRLNQRIRMTSISPGEQSHRELVKILEQENSIFYLLADQYFAARPDKRNPDHLVALDFLNQTVYLDITGVQLAKQKGSQPLTAIPIKATHAHQVLIEPMQWINAGTTVKDIAQDLQFYIARFERQLLEYPALWRDLRRPDLFSRIGIS